MSKRRVRPSEGRAPWACLAISCLFIAGCSPKRIAINSIANMLTSGSSAFASDDDPDLVGDALPFALISLEGLAREAPDHVGVRAALAAGFAQYGYGWADVKAQLVKFEDYDKYQAYTELARKRYLRGWRWGMEGLELVAPGFEARLAEDPAGALEEMSAEELPLLYWTGTAWLAAISASMDRVDLIGQLPQAAALLERAFALDPDYDTGGLHEIFVALDMARGPGAGGGEASALTHYERALALSEGHRASVHVGYATSIAVKKQDRKRFLEELDKALAIDVEAYPEYRLSNFLAQARAAYLKAHVDDLFETDGDF